jgi:hypothetical protein
LDKKNFFIGVLVENKKTRKSLRYAGFLVFNGAAAWGFNRERSNIRGTRRLARTQNRRADCTLHF